MILVTGHKGFVGSNLVRSLDPKEVKLLEKLDTYFDWCTHLFALMTSIEFDTVIHCGAISDNQYKDADILDWNTRCTRTIAEMCGRQGVHLIYLSSQTARSPQTLYGYSKHLSELFIHQISGLNACIFQPFNIWGEDESMKPVHCQSLPYRLAANNLEILWDTNRDYVHVDDVVSAINIARNNRIFGTYHLGTTQTTSSHDLAKAVEYDGYEVQETPLHIENYTCAVPADLLPGWKHYISDIANRIHNLEPRLSDPFDSVEISLNRAKRQAKKERRWLTQDEIKNIECSAEQRNAEL